MLSRYRRLLLTGVGLTLLALGLAPAGASSANISKSYHTTTPITKGSLVSLDPSRSNYVQLANTNNGSRLTGVAVNSSESLIAADTTPGNAQVATSGNAPALVSTLNGDIHVGDQVSVSPLSGVGMKATSGSRIIGLAQTDFNARTDGAAAKTLKNRDGEKKTVYVGYIRTSIAISNSSNNSGVVLNNLQKTVQSLTGHTVSTPRITISVAVVVVTVVALVTLTYASIYGSIISVGRNPLAKYAVFRTLGSVLAMALLTTLVAGVAVYLLLK